jgi:hypothetical protein
MNVVHRSCMALACCLATLGSAPPAARGATAEWTNSNLDVFFYNMAVSAGQRDTAPSFTGGLTINAATQQFDARTSIDPARLGADLTAFNTALFIAPNLSSSRYQINSVTFKATWAYGLDSPPIYYQNTPITQQQMLSEVAGDNVSTQKPFELYGVGFRNGYTGFDLPGPATPGPPLLDEGTKPYPNGLGYNAYPVVGTNTAGTYVDVSNSVTGGYSATDPAQNTNPFTPTPWAIGTNSNLSPGDVIPDNSTFTFSLDLSQPGVLSYVQQSLAKGSLGFFISSLHSTTEFGASGGYPRWFTKEAQVAPYHPQLAIDYQILPEGVPGDYNGNGVVDVADYVAWRKGGTLLNQVDDPTQVNQQDYIAWRARFGNAAGSGTSKGLVEGTAIPEPSTVFLLLFLMSFFASCRHKRNR